VPTAAGPKPGAYEDRWSVRRPLHLWSLDRSWLRKPVSHCGYARQALQRRQFSTDATDFAFAHAYDRLA